MAQLRTSTPSPQATELRRWQLSSPADLRRLRASLHQALTGEELLAGEELDEVPELMVLVATELATNALRHSIPPTTVRLLVAEDRFILEVADHDLSTIPELVDTRPMGTGGRGLQIAEAVSLDIGWYATDRTKNIWAAFPRS
ncbi:ATP-binding protein [Micromonospora sp. U56]|uniref:ATP-binding protein n=1 Tax=Micromonospora sp. U56 TaxID=2824900 RepID=UPI001B3999CE|nr:ATP-binding protein [Micromonospora sp. U56]MBQ0892641.1 ATP-binding protein [Micromonospora sp. U56]